MYKSFFSLMRSVSIVCMVGLMLSGCGNNAGLTIANNVAKMSGGYELVSNQRFGPNERNGLDIYQPLREDSKTLRPVVVFFYGGCWGACWTGSKDSYPFVAQAITEMGFIAVVPDYRLYPDVKIDAILEDGANAVKWVRQHIREYGGDENNIYLMGHSAGAHIGVMLTLNPSNMERVEGDRDWIKGFIGLAGPYDFELNKPYQKTLFGPPPRFPASQPINFATGSAPPLLLLHGDSDPRVNQRNSVKLQAKVSSLGGVAEVKLYQEINHTQIIGVFSALQRYKAPVVLDIEQFINRLAHSKTQPNLSTID